MAHSKRGRSDQKREGEKKRLAELCDEIFTVMVQLEKLRETEDFDFLRMKLNSILRNFENDAKDVSYEHEEIENAKFALISMMDEKVNWTQQPLQLEHFNTPNAGEEFFERMEKVRGNSQVLEVFYLCLSLGFKGKYQIYEQEKLKYIISDAYRDLRRMLPERMRDRSADLSTHAYPDESSPTESIRSIPFWPLFASILVIGLLFYIGFFMVASNAANSAAEFIRNIPLN
ncbi:MAG: hypothetical protein B6244_03980 [Candidatus Cloacimonetes bacterium 4572_55]|nr:MAG: hypothetical protein B6244_03980 [Candidatus Cloacimonetes bacterium 4572_55]